MKADFMCTLRGLKLTMHNLRFFKWIIIVIVSFTLGSCATTNLPQIGADEKQPNLQKDEIQLWRNAEQIERLIDESGILYNDNDLQEYLEMIAYKLLPQNIQKQNITLRIKIIQHPFLNAFALPNGTVYLHTGILARMDNEAQLAAVLGHELTHFTHRHTLKEMRDARNKQAFFGTLQTICGVAGAAYGGAPLGGLLTELTGQTGAVLALASVMGYSRELETEADAVGLQAMINAYYDPKEALKVFEHLQQELKEQNIQEPFFFGTHPRLQERIDNYQMLLSTQYTVQSKDESRLKNTEEFRSRTEKLIFDNAVLDMQIGRLNTAQTSIEKYLKRQSNCARAYFLLGEIHRRGGRTESHYQQAIDAYLEAIRLDPDYADAHRGLGLVYRAQNKKQESCDEFNKYLALNPQAIDSNIVRGYLAEMGMK
jgi:predicted Zn-dependent protease